MAVATTPLVEQRIPAIVGALAAAEDGALKGLLDDLVAPAFAAIETNDLRAVTRLRERLDRVRRGLLEHDPDGREAVAFTLSVIDGQLDRSRTRIVARQQAERQERRDVGVRDEVLGLLHTPRRPSDIARQLRRDPSEISRAIAELRGRDLIVETTAPASAAPDRRARWFVAAPSPVHVDAA
jgi:hypothetical protein